MNDKLIFWLTLTKKSVKSWVCKMLMPQAPEHNWSVLELLALQIDIISHFHFLRIWAKRKLSNTRLSKISLTVLTLFWLKNPEKYWKFGKKSRKIIWKNMQILEKYSKFGRRKKQINWKIRKKNKAPENSENTQNLEKYPGNLGRILLRPKTKKMCLTGGAGRLLSQNSIHAESLFRC